MPKIQKLVLYKLRKLVARINFHNPRLDEEGGEHLRWVDRMIDDFNVPNKRVELFNYCAEDTLLGGREFDLVFTSPPYFNIERYTQEDNQSFKKYRKLENWLNDFLFKAIDLSWKHLKPKGHLVLNISDVYSNHTINQICDPMNDYISILKGSKYVGCYGYQMMTRPNSGALKGKTGKFAEPMWVWKKT